MKRRVLFIAKFLLLGFVYLHSQTSNATDHEFVIETSDVVRFERLMEKWSPGNDSKNQALIDRYLSSGTEGLQAFYRIKIRDKKKFLSAIDRLYTHYQSLDAYDFDVETLRPKLTTMFTTFQQWSDEAKPMDIYLVVGRFSSAGTVYRNGILVGSEHLMSSVSEQLLQQGLKPRSIDSLLPTIAHEYVHSLQRQAGDKRLIRAVIFEGGADFLAELATGMTPSQKPHYQFGFAHEQKVWNKFREQMNGTDVSEWIANRSKSDWPADLGYFVGYQIAKSFYQNMSDKRLAFYHLTHVTDPEYILRVSQYEQ